MTDVQVYIQSKAELGESPVWDAKKDRLLWVDISLKRLHLYDYDKKIEKQYQFDDEVGNVFLDEDEDILLALGDQIIKYNLKTSKLTDYFSLENKAVRFNDGKCDSDGRVYIGTTSNTGEMGTCHLYCIENEKVYSEKESNISISNGLGWSPDNSKMYYIDSPTRQIWSYDYDLSTGTMDNKRVIINFSEEDGVPDGMTVDSNGCLWVAHWGGAKVSVWNPSTYECKKEIPIPAPHVTSCTFGGANMNELFITTARVDLTKEELENYPLSGSVFRYKASVTGLPTNRFK